MKRTIAMILCLFLMLAAIGCGQGVKTPSFPTDTTSGQSSSDSGAETTLTPGTDGTTGGTEPEMPFRTGYSDDNVIIETPTRIVYFKNIQMCYYNKLDGESYVFCFDPLCDHQNWIQCISFRFPEIGISIQNMEYCAYNNRFYALRGQKLCSFGFDGSDLRIDHSFGEAGGFDEDFYDPFGLIFLRIYERYVYLLANDSETGERQLMRYDVSTGKTANLSENKGMYISNYLLGDETVYLSVRTEGKIGMYRANLDLTEIEPISGMEAGISDGIFDGKRLYFRESRYEYDEETDQIKAIPAYISAYDPESGGISRIYEINDGISRNLLAVTEDAVYFTAYDPIYYGYYIDVRGEKKIRRNCYSKIYRMDKDGGNLTLILDDIHYETYQLYIGDSIVLINGSYCKPGEGDAKSNGAFFIGKLDENGMIVDIEIVDPIE